DRSIRMARAFSRLTSRGTGGNRYFPQELIAQRPIVECSLIARQKNTRWRRPKGRRQRGNGWCGAADASSTHARDRRRARTVRPRCRPRWSPYRTIVIVEQAAFAKHEGG